MKTHCSKLLIYIYFIVLFTTFESKIFANDALKVNLDTKVKILAAQVLENGETILYAIADNQRNKHNRAHESLIITINESGDIKKEKLDGHLESVTKLPNSEAVLLTLSNLDKTSNYILLYEKGVQSKIFTGLYAVTDISSSGELILLKSSVPSSKNSKYYDQTLLVSDLTGDIVNQWELKQEKKWEDGDLLHPESWLSYRFSIDEQYIHTAVEHYPDAYVTGIRYFPVDGNSAKYTYAVPLAESAFRFIMINPDQYFYSSRKIINGVLSNSNNDKFSATSKTKYPFKEVTLFQKNKWLLGKDNDLRNGFTVWNIENGKEVLSWHQQNDVDVSLKPLAEYLQFSDDNEKRFHQTKVELLANNKLIYQTNANQIERFVIDLNNLDKQATKYSINNFYAKNRLEFNKFDLQNTINGKYIYQLHEEISIVTFVKSEYK